MNIKAQLRDLLPALRRYAYSLTGSMPDADDLLQSTIERLLTRDIPEDVELSAWAFRICRNMWIDEHRARQVRERAANEPVLQEQQHDGERSVHSQLMLDKVKQAMNKLKDEQRELLALVAVEGMSYREVACALEIPIGTVMSRLARARASLAQQLAPTS